MSGGSEGRLAVALPAQAVTVLIQTRLALKLISGMSATRRTGITGAGWRWKVAVPVQRSGKSTVAEGSGVERRGRTNRVQLACGLVGRLPCGRFRPRKQADQDP
jgi:hypothetical protein